MTFIFFHYGYVSSASDISAAWCCLCSACPCWRIFLTPHLLFSVRFASDFSLLSAWSPFFYFSMHSCCGYVHTQLWLVLLDLQLLWIFTVPANISLACVKAAAASPSLLHPHPNPVPSTVPGAAIPCLRVYSVLCTSRVILGKGKFLPYVHVLLLR